tara:strand:- start:72 stop:281 length:210 start_codon:yes stop_codon:yes gene_type:complete
MRPDPLFVSSPNDFGGLFEAQGTEVYNEVIGTGFRKVPPVLSLDKRRPLLANLLDFSGRSPLRHLFAFV